MAHQFIDHPSEHKPQHQNLLWIVLAGVIAIAALSALSIKPVHSANIPIDLLPDSATISGIVHYTGTPPRRKRVNMITDPVCGTSALSEDLIVTDGGVENVFVYVSRGLEGKSFRVPDTTVTLNQKECWFRPRLLGIMVGQKLRILSSDPTLHNVHSHSKLNQAFNLAQANQGKSDIKVFAKEEVMIPITDDVHIWKVAYIAVLNHPYFAVTGTGGRYSLPSLRPGTYTITIWHERLGTYSERVTVTSGESRTLDFSMSLDGAESASDSTKK